MMKRIAVLIVMIAGPLLFAVAQQNPIAVLEYFDSERDLFISDEDGFEVNFYVGMGLSPGDRVSTENTSVEIRLEPNRSIIRVAPYTQFTLEGLQDRDGAEANSIGIGRGKVRMIAARYANRDTRYEIRTPSGIAGVRGTDFGVSVVPAPEEDADEENFDNLENFEAPATLSEELFVFDGEVIYTNTETEEAIFLSGGQRADIRAEEFLPVTMDGAESTERRRNLDFARLDPASVPGVTAQVQPETVEVAPPPPEPEDEPEDDTDGFFDRVFGKLAEVSALEVGSITINEETFARVAFQPHLSVGRLDVAFHLPIIYRDNLVDPGEWYRPGGNNEWSFGTDQNWNREPVEGLQDLGTDLALKIRYLTYAERGEPFFIKVGNLSTFTIGQGLLMRNYANDVDFPVVRRIGFNTGFDLNSWGLEGMINDLADPYIYGGRLFFRPAAPVIPAAVGISAITDLYPGKSISLQDQDGDPLDEPVLSVMEAAQRGEPIFVNVAMDLEVPLFDRESFGLVGFAEAGGLIPYLREPTDLGDSSLNAGLKTSALVDFSSGDLKNFGWTVGARGDISFLDYRLEVRRYDGIFRPAFYGPSYDRLRNRYAAETVAYLIDTSAEEYGSTTMAVAAELSARIGEILVVSGGYTLPWEIEDDGDWSSSDDDEIILGAAAREGLIPFGITAGAEYRRSHFAATIAEREGYEKAHLFDAYTRLDTYIRYPLSEIVDLEARLSTSVVRDEEGDIVYDRRGDPRIAPVLAIQTRIGF
jgi:hypothetical protein